MNQNKQNEICAECGGLCCKIQCADIHIDDAYQKEYWEARGYIKKIYTLNKIIYLTKQKCDQLDENNKCRIYDKRPQLCKDFPGEYLHKTWKYFCPLWHYLKEKNKYRNSVLKVL